MLKQKHLSYSCNCYSISTLLVEETDNFNLGSSFPNERNSLEFKAVNCIPIPIRKTNQTYRSITQNITTVADLLDNLCPSRYTMATASNRPAHRDPFHTNRVSKPLMIYHSTGISPSGWHYIKHLQHEISFQRVIGSVVFLL